jgi:hypothetical protein
LQRKSEEEGFCFGDGGKEQKETLEREKALSEETITLMI